MTATATELSPSRRIAAEVRAELARRGLSVRRFAMANGLDPMWLSRRIGRTSNVAMTFEDLDVIATALGVSATKFVTASGWLPRLDSNQQPSGYPSSLVSAVAA